MFYISVDDIEVWHNMEGRTLRYCVNISYTHNHVYAENIFIPENFYAIKTSNIHAAIARLRNIHMHLYRENNSRPEIRLVFDCFQKMPETDLQILFEYLRDSENIWQIECFFSGSNNESEDYISKLDQLLNKKPEIQLRISLPYGVPMQSDKVFQQLLALKHNKIYLFTNLQPLEPDFPPRACTYTPEHYSGMQMILRANQNLNLTLMPMLEYNTSLMQFFNPELIFRVRMFDGVLLDNNPDLLQRLRLYPEEFENWLPCRQQRNGLISFCYLQEQAAKLLQTRIYFVLDNYMRLFASLWNLKQYIASRSNDDIANQLILKNYKLLATKILQIKANESYLTNSRILMRDKLGLLHKEYVISNTDFLDALHTAASFYTWGSHIKFQMQTGCLSEKKRLLFK